MMRLLIGLVLVLAACAPVTQPSALASATPTSSLATTTAPAATTSPAPPPAAPVARLENPIVAIASAQFPIARTFGLTQSALVPGDEEAARWGVERYLEGLDRYRDQGDFLPVSGRFGQAVAAALVESRTPGVRRTFVLQSLRIEHLYRKPWGTQALADVRVTIADRAVDRSVPDQLESGRLRLSGDRRLIVVDSWDDSTGTWFNGRPSEDPAGLRESTAQAIAAHLRTESWVVGGPVETYYDGVDATPFKKARAAYLATFDRAAITSRTFADVTGAIERYDTFAELPGGIATVRLAATVMTTDGAGRTQRQPVTRSVKVFFGNWLPEVVDEEVTPGIWRSAGDLALAQLDINRA